jgi:MFS transporter, NNP family, nitrate/nitrite transporter
MVLVRRSQPMNRAPRQGNGRMLAVGTLAFTLCFYAWSLLGPLGPDLQDHLGLSDLQLSVMVAVPVILGSVMRVPMGVLTDRYGGRVIFVALMAWTVIPLIALAIWHDSLGVVIALGFLLGFAGSSFAIGVPFVSRWYPASRQGYALGVYGMGMGGTVLAGLTAPHIADEWGLAAPFIVAAGLLAVIAVVFFAMARDAPGERMQGSSLWGSLAVFRGKPRAWALTLFYFLAFGGFVAMFLYLPKLLTGVFDLSKTDAGARAAGFALLAVLARPIGGVLSDRLGADRVLRWSFVATAALAAILAATYTHIVPLTIACLSLAVAFGLGTGAVFKLVASWFPGEVGAVTGVVGAAGGLGGFFPPLVMGIVKSATGGYAIGFVLLAAVAVACFVVLAGVRETQVHAAATRSRSPA